MQKNEESQLYIHLKYQENTYYIADSAITGNYTYWPFLSESPTISYSGSGYLKVSSGRISILKDYDNNEYHPFMGDRYLSVLTSVQEIPFEIYIGNDLVPVFSGTLALESVTESVLNFTILEEEFEEGLTHPVLDENRQESKNILFIEDSSGELYPVIEMFDNPYSDGEEVIFESKAALTGKTCNSLIYDKIRKNRYIVTDRTTSFFRIFNEEYPDELITIDNLGLSKADLILASDTTYASIKTKFNLGSSKIYKLSTDQVYYIGSASPLPFSFGELSIRNPIIRYGEEQVSSTWYFLIKNPQIDYNLSSFHLYDGGVEVTDNVNKSLSNNEHIYLSAMPIDEIAISGTSLNGSYLSEFFTLCCSYLRGDHLSKTTDIDMENLDSVPDFTMSPNATSTKLSVFQDSEITMLEMASRVASTTNHIFYFEAYTSDSGEYRRRLKLIDLNEVLFNDSNYPIQKEIREDDQISVDLNYPYPIKAIESTIQINRLYQGIAEEERNRSQMKRVSLDFRVDVHSIGNIEKKDVFAQTVSEGKMWLNRLKRTGILPTVQLNLRDIQKDLHLGAKIRVFDFVREFMADIVINEISFNFSGRNTMVKGIGIIKQMERY